MISEGSEVIRHMKMTTSDPRTAHVVCFEKSERRMCRILPCTPHRFRGRTPHRNSIGFVKDDSTKEKSFLE